MIRRLDLRLLDLHQRVVDLTQRTPAWLAEQCAIAMVVSNTLRAVIAAEWDWAMALLVAFAILFWCCARVPMLLAIVGASPFTRLWFAFWLAAESAALLLLAAFGQPVGAGSMLGLLHCIAITAFAYFAACRPPRPRVPRRRAVLAGGAA